MTNPPAIQPTNTHVYVDRGLPLVSACVETLSDGSKVWNLHFNVHEIGCASETDAKTAVAVIAAALEKFSMAKVLML